MLPFVGAEHAITVAVVKQRIPLTGELLKAFDIVNDLQPHDDILVVGVDGERL
jgi:hypothetical protein